MPALKRTSAGAWKARARIPDDVRPEYKRPYGQGYEAKLFVPEGTKEPDAKKRYGDWLAEHEGRVAAIRAARDGTGTDLTPQAARRLAGDWAEWFLARRAGSDLHFVEYCRDEVQAAIGTEAAEALARDENPDDLWWKDSELRAAVRPVLADIAETAQFLAAKGLQRVSAWFVPIDGVLTAPDD